MIIDIQVKVLVAIYVLATFELLSHLNNKILNFYLNGQLRGIVSM